MSRRSRPFIYSDYLCLFCEGDYLTLLWWEQIQEYWWFCDECDSCWHAGPVLDSDEAFVLYAAVDERDIDVNSMDDLVSVDESVLPPQLLTRKIIIRLEDKTIITNIER